MLQIADCNRAKNTLCNRLAHSPLQREFVTPRRLPRDLVSDDPCSNDVIYDLAAQDLSRRLVDFAKLFARHMPLFPSRDRMDDAVQARYTRFEAFKENDAVMV